MSETLSSPGAGGGRSIGVVAIGRNEGPRLEACLASLSAFDGPVVYVDSGSTDGSVKAARAAGANVVNLDMSTPFTAARARNEGFSRLKELGGDGLRFVQFIDGDCEIADGWLDRAEDAMASAPRLAAVGGRRREKFRTASIFNTLCDMEWDTPVGPARAIGGDGLYRADAFVEVGGFDGAFICGEEPELCYRLRGAGWLVERLDAEMTRHDADITTWSEWAKRNVRSGWAFAEGADRMGGGEERYNVKQARSIFVWGLGAPLAVAALLIFALAAPSPQLTLGAQSLAALGVAAFFAMALKIGFRRRADRGDSWRDSLLYGAMLMLGKFPQAAGALKYWRKRLSGGQATIIEYKKPAADGADASRGAGGA